MAACITLLSVDHECAHLFTRTATENAFSDKSPKPLTAPAAVASKSVGTARLHTFCSGKRAGEDKKSQLGPLNRAPARPPVGIDYKCGDRRMLAGHAPAHPVSISETHESHMHDAKSKGKYAKGAGSAMDWDTAVGTCSVISLLFSEKSNGH